MANFFTADHHFGHANIIKYTGRPYENAWFMDRDLKRRWNGIISRNDNVYHLGDLCFPRGRDMQNFVESLNGRIVLIKGNHDKKKTLDAVDEWHANLPLKIGGYNCVLNHRPVYPKGTPDPYGDHDKSIDPDEWDFILCGHVHEKWLWNGKSFNVGVDVHRFWPLCEDEVINFLEERMQCTIL